MFNIQSNLPLLPGLPGYGVIGNDGKKGLNGIALYISSLNAVYDYDMLRIDISLSHELNGSGVPINGYPNRKYQDGDYFIDTASNICQINFAKDNYYEITPLKLNSFDIFMFSNIISNIGFKRYTNIVDVGEQIIIDDVVSNKIDDYKTDLEKDSYGILFKDFAKVYYNDIVNDKNIINYELLTSGMDDHAALALSYNKDTGAYHIGNKDINNRIRNTNITFDLRNIAVNRQRPISIDDDNCNVLTNVELNAPYLFEYAPHPDGIDVTTQANSVIIKWNKGKFFRNLLGGGLNKIQMDLVFYQPISISGNTYNFDNTPNNNIYIYDLGSIGTLTITNLLANTEYKCYLIFSYNGYSRTSNIIRTVTGLVPTLSLTCDGQTFNDGDTLYIPAILTKPNYTFDVVTNSPASWTISEQYNTFTNTLPKTGIGSSSFNVNISGNNYDATQRRDKFNIALDQYSSKQLTINIVQSSFDGYLTCLPSALDFSYNDEVRSVSVNTNLGSWSVYGPSWCEISAPNGMVGNQTINIKPSSNDSTMGRSDNISVISNVRPDVSTSIIINQSGKPVVQNTVTPDKTGLLFDGDGTEQSVKLVFNNNEFFSVTTPSWMQCTPTSGYPQIPPSTGNPLLDVSGIYTYTIKLKCSSYIGSIRNGVVTVTNGSGSCQIMISQNSIVEPPSIDPGIGGGCLEITTPVTLVNGFTVQVGDVKPGYKILGHYAEDIHEFGYKGYDTKPRIIENTVLDIKIKEFKTYYEINNEFKCSTTHNMFIFRDGVWQWILSPCLKEGDYMFHITGKKVPITKIEFFTEPIKVAYLTLLRPNTYFGAGYLHHNTAQEKEIAID